VNPPAGGAIWESRAVRKDERRGVIKQGISRARGLGHVLLGFLPRRKEFSKSGTILKTFVNSERQQMAEFTSHFLSY